MFGVKPFNYLSIAGAAIVLVSEPVFAQSVQITGVSLDRTDILLEVILETDGTPEFVITTEGRVLQVDALDASLNLLGAQEFRAENPYEGIELVTVTAEPGNIVRVRITGVQNPPEAQATIGSRGLVVSAIPVAGDPGQGTAEERDPDIEIISTRREETVEEVPRSITVVDRDEIEQQTVTSNDIGDLLGKTVPGFGPSNQSRTTRGQTLRGREPLVLIDGVPLNSNFRVNRQELRSIDPSAIERVEVLRGPSALYGGQGTGGVINIITRIPQEEGLQFNLRGGFNNSFSNLDGSTFGDNAQATFSGLQDDLGFVFNVSQEYAGSFFDGDGDRIPAEGSLSDTNSLNLLAKIEGTADNHKLILTANRFDSFRDTEFFPDRTTLFIPGRQKARSERITGLEYEDFPRDRKTILSGTYTNSDILFGSNLLARLYLLETLARGDFADGRPIPALGRGIEFFDTVFQSRLENRKIGTRLQLDSPLTTNENLTLFSGLDYNKERNVQITDQFDEGIFARENRLSKIREVDFTPPYVIDNFGVFAQLKWNINDTVIFNGGVRYENINVNVDEYTTARDSRFIQGGQINADDVVFNLGAVYNITPQVNVFANFGQGFFLPDLGRLFRNPPQGFVSVEEDVELTEPIKVTEYEIGLRSSFERVQFTLAGFYNESPVGASLTPDATGFLTLDRAPQRIYGVEATFDLQPTQNWNLGTTFGWSEGENRPEDLDEYIPLNSGEIAPYKLSAYLENETLPGWTNRLQLLYVGDRDRAFEAIDPDGLRIDPFPINGYLLLDFISSIPIGPGNLQIGIENLLNNQYYPVASQYLGGLPLAAGRPDLPNDTSYTPGRGTTFRFLYQVKW